MNKDVIQFFCEFYNFSNQDIKILSENIDCVDDITDEYIHSFLTNYKKSKYNIDTNKKIFYDLKEKNYKKNIDFITFLDEEYPQTLQNIQNIPKILYYKGDINLINYEKNIGVVGSRKPTSYGIWATKSIVKDLVDSEFCIVSGFAGGIDSISHKTSLDNNGKTICVFGTCLDKIYPIENKKMYQQVIDTNNLIISENSGIRPTNPRDFAKRNRIISGISSSLLITEAGAKSGTLITANYAINQGKSIFVVPGNINSINSVGANSLIKDGAFIVTGVSDILEQYDISPEKIIDKSIQEVIEIDDLSDDEKKVYMAVKSSISCHSEKISISLGMDIQDVMSILNILDIKGYITYDGFMATYKTR